MKLQGVLVVLCVVQVLGFQNAVLDYQQSVRNPNVPNKLHQLYSPRPVLKKNFERFGISSAPNLPLGGDVWPTGGYYTTIYLGVPPQKTVVQIDTGSSDLLVAQVGCKKCPEPKYNPNSSRESQNVTCSTSDFRCALCIDDKFCGFNNTYETCDFFDPTASCSLIGQTYYDRVTVSDEHVTVGFGGIEEHQGAPDTEWTNMPGVMGMGYRTLSSVWLDATVFDTYVQAGKYKNVFAMCVSDTKGGVLTWGGVDPGLYTGSLEYTPVILDQWYVLNMTDISVDGTSVGLDYTFYNKIGDANVKGTILDSGTNTFVVNGIAYDIMFSMFVETCKERYLPGICMEFANETLFQGECFAMNEKDLVQFPKVGIHLTGLTQPLILEGKDYLKPHPEKKGAYCLEIQSSGLQGFTIMGNVAQSPFYTVFDRANNRLGFAPKSEKCNQ